MLSRRSFLKIVSSTLAASGIKLKVFDEKRLPYVNEGECVDYIGPSPGFIGGRIVKSVGNWDGVGYPCELWDQGFGKNRTVDVFYDFDLCIMRNEIPSGCWSGFWSIKGNVDKYPNIQTYVRMKRFGESLHEAIYKQGGFYKDEFLKLYPNFKL